MNHLTLILSGIAIIGSFGLGVVLTYIYLQQRIRQQKLELNHLHQQALDRMERDHQARLQQMTECFQAQTQSTLQQLETSYQHRLEELQSAQDQSIAQLKLEMEVATENKYQGLLAEWKASAEKSIRKKSVESSRNAIKGQLTEQLIPLFPGLNYNPADMRFLGSPIDYIIFQGYTEAKDGPADIQAVIIADIKRGKYANLSGIQEKIKAAVEAGRVYWQTIYIDDESNLTLTDLPITQSEFIENPGAAELPRESNPIDLRQQILDWGDSGRLDYVPQLVIQAESQSYEIRRLVASAIGKIAAVNPTVTVLEQAIPALAKLSQDDKPQIRQYAVKALGNITSLAVRPLLEAALNDPVDYVAQAAQTALQKWQ